MKRITSFSADHDYIDEGMYVSRIDGDITTYDIRARKPNTGDVLDNVTMHTMEHMVATYIRNSEIADDVIYFGPMGCQTGFYLLIRNAKHDKVFEVIKEILQKIISYNGEVFGNTRKECGNYKSLNLDSAKYESILLLSHLETQESIHMEYPKYI